MCESLIDKEVVAGTDRRAPFDEVLIDLLSRARLVKSFQVVNGLHPERLARALAGEHVGTIVHAD